MDTFSRLDSAAPISPGSGRVWQAQKKRRTGDHKERDEGQNRKEKGEKKDEEFILRHDGQSVRNEQRIPDQHNEEQAVYGTNGHKKNVKRKIDVVI